MFSLPPRWPTEWKDTWRGCNNNTFDERHMSTTCLSVGMLLLASWTRVAKSLNRCRMLLWVSFSESIDYMCDLHLPTGVAAPNNHPALLTSSGQSKPLTTAHTDVVFREPST